MKGGRGEEGEGLFFFQSGWVSTLKYLILVVGVGGDIWIYFKFCMLGLCSCFRVYGVVEAFHLMPLMLYGWEGSHFCLFFNLISLESLKSSISFGSVN